MAVKPEPERTATPEDIRRYKANLDDEIDGIAIYHLLAEAEPDPDRRAIFEQLADVEQRHADVWRKKLREAGVEIRERGPSLRIRLIGFLARRFGVRSVLPIVRGMEAGAYGAYMAQDEAAQAIAPDEREHGRTLARMQRPEVTPAEAIAARETWHRTGGGGTLRASIFGVSDGLLAGAFSMAAGEYVSMRAQRELFERQIELERGELEAAPEEEQRELALIYQAKGLPKEQAEAMAARLMENPEVALDTLVREELGLDPASLGSPWGAPIGPLPGLPRRGG